MGFFGRRKGFQPKMPSNSQPEGLYKLISALNACMPSGLFFLTNKSIYSIQVHTEIDSLNFQRLSDVVYVTLRK